MPARPRKTAAPDARKAEALAVGVSVTFAGHNYTTMPYRDWDIDVMEAVEDGRYVAALSGILGDKEWALFRTRHRSVGDLVDFLNAVLEATGQGNS